jgi:hypothetical protein
MKTITKTITVEMPERVIRLKRKKVDAVALKIKEEKHKSYEDGYAAAKKKFEGLSKAVKKERWKKVSGHRMPEKKPLLVAHINVNRVCVDVAIYFKKEKIWISSNTGETMKTLPVLWCDVIPTLTTEHITRVT